jgi:hypothetical protein
MNKALAKVEKKGYRVGNQIDLERGIGTITMVNLYYSGATYKTKSASASLVGEEERELDHNGLRVQVMADLDGRNFDATFDYGELSNDTQPFHGHRLRSLVNAKPL